MDVLPDQDPVAEGIPSRAALIVFIKNPVVGKVKTRLAASIGEGEAFKVYQRLLEHTFEITKDLKVDKYIFYSDFIPETDEWQSKGFRPELQNGGDLGERMWNAFEVVFKKGFDNTVIVGSDCIELDTEILENSFRKLDGHKVVIGPANDGGYYLLGMNDLYRFLFENKAWSTQTVYSETLKDCRENNLSVYELPVLIDIDTIEDLQLFEGKSKEVVWKS